MRFFQRRNDEPSRGADRVPCEAATSAEDVEVALDVAEQSVAAWLHDLSTTGLSLTVAGGATGALAVGAQAIARFTLPDAGEAFVLGAVVVHDTDVDGARRVGLRLDPSTTVALEAQVERILQWVLARQRRVASAPSEEERDAA